jgi:hypothetical protein
MLQKIEERRQKPRQGPEVFSVALFGVTAIIVIAFLVLQTARW